MTDAEIGKMVDKIQNEGRNLTDWEKNFVQSCVNQYKRKGSLSERQVEILERIYVDKTPTGTTFGEGSFTGRFGSEARKTERVRSEGRITPLSEERHMWREKGYDDDHD